MTFYDDTYGALLVGLTISAALWGITNLQVLTYSRSYPRDLILHKLAVVELWLLDAFHLALVAHGVYHYLITNRRTIVLDIIWSLKLEIAIGCIAIISVQSLYIFQIWRICDVLSNETRRVQWILVVLLLLTYAATVTVIWAVYSVQSIPQINKVHWVIYMSTATATCVDFMISLILCLSLMRRQTGSSRRNSWIRDIAMTSVRNGLLTVAGALLEIATLAILPNTLIVFAVNIVLIKVYVNSYLALLNARPSAKERSTSCITPVSVTTARATSSSFFAPDISHPWTVSYFNAMRTAMAGS